MSNSNFIFYKQPNAETFEVYDHEGNNVTTEYSIANIGYALQLKHSDGLLYILRHTSVAKIIGRPLYLKTDGVKPAKVVDSISGDSISQSTEISTKAIQVKMGDFDPQLFESIPTGITVLDQFFSRRMGIAKASNIIIAGEPGGMKTSFLFHILNQAKITNPDKKMLYISAGEMRSDEVADVAQYYPGFLDNVHLLFANQALLKGEPFHKVIEQELQVGYDLVVVDSWAALSGIIGDDSDMKGKAIELWFLRILDKNNMAHNDAKKFTTFLIIQQVTKGGVFVGANSLVHMTQAFAYLRVDPKAKGKRYIEFTKNRIGIVGVKLYYYPKADGIGFDSDRYNLETDLMKLDSVPESKTSKLDFITKLKEASMNRQMEEFDGE